MAFSNEGKDILKKYGLSEDSGRDATGGQPENWSETGQAILKKYGLDMSRQNYQPQQRIEYKAQERKGTRKSPWDEYGYRKGSKASPNYPVYAARKAQEKIENTKQQKYELPDWMEDILGEKQEKEKKGLFGMDAGNRMQNLFQAIDDEAGKYGPTKPQRPEIKPGEQGYEEELDRLLQQPANIPEAAGASWGEYKKALEDMYGAWMPDNTDWVNIIYGYDPSLIPEKTAPAEKVQSSTQNWAGAKNNKQNPSVQEREKTYGNSAYFAMQRDNALHEQAVKQKPEQETVSGENTRMQDYFTSIHLKAEEEKQKKETPEERAERLAKSKKTTEDIKAFRPTPRGGQNKEVTDYAYKGPWEYGRYSEGMVNAGSVYGAEDFLRNHGYDNPGKEPTTQEPTAKDIMYQDLQTLLADRGEYKEDLVFGEGLAYYWDTSNTPKVTYLHDETEVPAEEREDWIRALRDEIGPEYLKSKAKEQKMKSSFFTEAEGKQDLLDNMTPFEREAYSQGFKDPGQYQAYLHTQEGLKEYHAQGLTANDYYREVKSVYDQNEESYKQAVKALKQAKWELKAAEGLKKGENYYNGYTGQVEEWYEGIVADKQAAVEKAEKWLDGRAGARAQAQKELSFAEAARYSDLKYMPDYQETVDYGRTRWESLEPSIWDDRYRSVGEVKAGNVEIAGIPDEDLLSNDFYSYKTPIDGGMTSEQEETWFWLYGNAVKNGEEPTEAYEYADKCIREYREKINAAEKEQRRKAAEEAGALGSLGSAALDVLLMPTAVWDWMGDVGEYLNTGTIMPRTELSGHDISQAFVAGSADYWNGVYTPEWAGGKGLGDLYQLGVNMLESTASVLAIGPGSAIFFFGPAAKEGTEKCMERTGDPGKSIQYGGLCGVNAVATEYLSMDALINLDPETQFILRQLYQGCFEASEEVEEHLADTLVDALVNGDKSELDEKIKLYSATMGYEEARKKAWQEWSEELMWSAIGGYLSGAGNVAGYQLGHNVVSSLTKYKGEAQDLIGIAQLAQDDKATQQQISAATSEFEANEGRAKDGKGWISNLTAENLTRATEKAIKASDRKAITEAVKGRLQNFGVSGKELDRMAERIVNAAQKRAEGGKASPSFSTAAEQTTFNELVQQMNRAAQEGGEKQKAEEDQGPGWLDTSTLKSTQAERLIDEAKRKRDPKTQLQEAFDYSRIDISKDDLNMLTDGYVPQLSDLQTYVMAARDAYRLGKAGMTLPQAIESSDNAGKVADVQFRHAWQLGARAGGYTPSVTAAGRGATSPEGGGKSASGTAAEKSGTVSVEGLGDELTIQGISRSEQGEIALTVQEPGGESVPVSLGEIDFGESGLGDLVQAIQSRADAPLLFEAYESGTDIGDFLAAWDAAKAYGKKTARATAESFFNDPALQGVSQDVIRKAFEAGRQERGAKEAPSVAAAGRGATSPEGGGKSEAKGKKGPGKNGKYVSYEGGTVDGVKLAAVDRSKLSKKQKAQISAVETLFEEKGIRAVLFQSEADEKTGRYKGAYGMYKDGVIYIDVNAGMRGRSIGQVAIIRTAAHELTHYIQDLSPERYQELQDFLLDHLTEWKGKTMGELAAQKQARASKELSMDEALDEVVADGCEMMLSRASVLQDMAQENKGLWNIVKNWVKKWVAQVQEAFQGVSAVHEEARAVEAMEAERLRKFTELWYQGLIEASEKGAKSPAKEGGETKYSIDPAFESNFDRWVTNGRPNSARLRVGTTSKALQSIDVPDMNIYWWSNSIKHAQEIHPEISDDVIKQVPDLIENPIIVMESKTQPNSITILGEVYGDNGIPVMAALRFTPNKDGVHIDKLEIVNTYTKTNPNAEPSIKGTQELINSSEILYVDPDEKRTNTWLDDNRLQLPLVTTYGPIGKITLTPKDVKGNFSSDTKEPTKTPMQLAFEKAAQKQEREDLPEDRELLMAAKAEGRNSDALEKYQKKVKSLEALERKQQRQQEALQKARESKNKAAVTEWQEKIQKTEESILRAQKALDDMERSPEIRKETEKALAAWREANPHEAARAIREMRQEQQSLKKYVELLRQEARLTTPEERKMLPSDVRKLAQSLVKEQSSQANVDSVTEQLQKLGDFMASNIQGAGADYYVTAVNQAKKIAKQILEQAYETIDDNKETNQGVREYLRSHTLNSEDVRGDIPDFDRWRKSHMGTLRLGKDGISIDQAYHDLQASYGEGFFPSDVLAASDQLDRILDVLDMTQATYAQMYNQYDSWQASEALGNEIVDRLLSGEVRERESWADQAFKQRMKQLEEKYARKDKARQQMLNDAEDRARYEAAKRDEAEERRREERALRRQLVAEKVHELRERSIDRDKRYRGRIAIDKKVVALSKIMLENSGKRHVPDAWKEVVGNFLGSIDTLTQHSGEKSRSFHLERIEALRDMAAKQQQRNAGQEDRGPQVFMDLNPYVAEMLEPFLKMARDSSTGMIEVERLSLEQMQQLEEVLTALREAVDKSDKMLADAEKGETLSGTAGETMEYLSTLGKGKTGGMLRRFLSWDNLTPVYFFKRFGAAGEKVFRGLQRGWGKLAFNAKNIIKFAEETYTAKEAREWEKETHEFKLVKREADLSGRESLTKAAKEGGPKAVQEAEEKNKTTVKISTAQLMGIYCLAKREQALGHILQGGIRIWDIEGKRGKTTEQADRYLVTAEDLAEMENALTPRQKEVADKLQKYMNTVGSSWGNEVSQARYGVDLFTEQNYYPISTDPMSRNARTPEADSADLFHLLNMGFTKNTIPKARNGIVIHSIFDVFANHMADMAKYNAMGLPMLDAMKWFNYVNDDPSGSFTSVRQAIERAYGKNAEKYFLAFIQDLNGSYEGGRRGEDIATKMISHAKVASVGANLRVAALQPTSYVRALAVLDPKYLLIGDNPARIRQGMKEAMQYSGTAVWKDLGFFDINVNRNLRDMIKHKDGAVEKARELSMWGAEMGDKVTWGRIWNACKAETKAKTGLSGEELLKATAERFDDVIYQTQVMDSTMTRSHLMRQKGAFASMMTSFMSEPTLSYNLLLDAVMNLNNARRSGKGLKAASGLAARAFITYAISQIAASVVESLFSALRDDDDYEDFWEKWKQAEFGWDGNLMQDLFLHNKLPYVRDVVSVLEGWTNKRMDTEWVEDLKRAYTAISRDIENGEFRWGTAYTAMNALSTMTGLPISNAARDGIALWNGTVVQSAPDWELKTVKTGTVKPQASVKQAFKAGALSEEDAVRYLIRDAELDEDKAKQLVFEWGLEKGEKKYDTLLAATKAGDSAAAEAARDELLANGYTEAQIQNAVREQAKKWYQGTAEDGSPRIDKETAIRILTEQGGMSRTDAQKRVNEWSSYISSPEQLQYDDIKEAFQDGEITEARAVEMRKLYGGKSEEDAKAEVRKWACYKETGIEYNDLDDAYISGEISEEEAVQYRMTYGGQSRKDAEKDVQEWKMERETGSEYDKLKAAFLAGDISEEKAVEYRMTYGGQSQKDAQKDVTEWKCEKETGIAYNELKDAYISGEISEEEAVQYRMTYGGQSQKDAQKAVQEWIYEKETGNVYDELRENFVSGELSYAEAVEARASYGKVPKAEAEKDVQKWKMEADTGIRYEDLAEQYQQGSVSKTDAEKYLQTYGGLAKQEAQEKVQQWGLYRDTGIEYSDLQAKFVGKELSERDAQSYLQKYGGKTKAEAEETVLQWKCERDTGVKYSELQEKYVGKELSDSKAVSCLQKYGGKTKVDAEATVKQWQCEKDTGIKFSSLQSRYVGRELTDSRAESLLQRYGGKTADEAKAEVKKWQCERDTGVKYTEIRDSFVGGEITESKAVSLLVKYGGKSQEDAQKQVNKYKFIGTDKTLDGISESAATTYYEQLAGTGMSKQTFYSAWKGINALEADYDANGKAINNSRLKKVYGYINALPMTAKQKDILLQMEYTSEKTLAKAPWH